jgi:hypothetical protein
MESIRFDKAKLERLRAEYERASKAGEDQFTFEGALFLVSYARYMIQYLDSEFSKR